MGLATSYQQGVKRSACLSAGVFAGCWLVTEASQKHSSLLCDSDEGQHFTASHAVPHNLPKGQPDSAAVLISDDLGRALILQRGHTAPWMPLKWNLPGGAIDEGETPPQAAIREALEETSLHVGNLSHLATLEYDLGRFVACYTCVVQEGELKITWENTAHAWIFARDLSQYEFVPGLVDVLLRLFANAPDPA